MDHVSQKNLQPKKADAEMPGAWVCDKCGFVLQKSVLHTGDGSISADSSPLNNTCPNDGVLMRPLTWREANEDIFNRCVDQMGRLRQIAELIEKVDPDTPAGVKIRRILRLAKGEAA